MSARRFTVRAPAKINLTLEVLGRRPDGFHELDTVLMALELGDVLVAEERAEACTLAVTGPAASGVPSDDSNLALRAARAVRELARQRGRSPGGVHIVLEKHVPAEAGLGGGSSDAAAVALACARLWDVGADDPELVAALARLGSDCVFFLVARESGLARCTGRGERVQPLPALHLPWSLALVTPPFGCSTAAVYRAFVPTASRERAPFEPAWLASAPLDEVRALLQNDLAAAAERAQPELRSFRARLDAVAPGAFQLAGSGSSCFGFFADDASARAALARISAEDRGRRYALRGQWLLSARSKGMTCIASSSH